LIITLKNAAGGTVATLVWVTLPFMLNVPEAVIPVVELLVEVTPVVESSGKAPPPVWFSELIGYIYVWLWPGSEIATETDTEVFGRSDRISVAVSEPMAQSPSVRLVSPAPAPAKAMKRPRVRGMVRVLWAAKSKAAEPPRPEETGQIVLLKVFHIKVKRALVSALALVVPPDDPSPMEPSAARTQPVSAEVL
jgi:hypothetical protein